MQPTTYAIETYARDEMVARFDEQENTSEVAEELRNAADAQPFVVRFYGDDGFQISRSAEGVFFPSEGSMVVWEGGDPTWAYQIESVEGGVEMYVNDPDAWEAAN